MHYHLNPKLTILTPPAELPVTLAATKFRLGVTDEEHDGHIKQLIRAGANSLVKDTGRALVTTTYQLKLNRFPYRDERVVLPYPNLISIDSLDYYDPEGQVVNMVEGTDYQVNQSGWTASDVVPMPKQCWPSTETGRVDAVTITYKAGYGDQSAVEEDAKQYIYVYCRNQYDNADGFMPEPVKRGLRALANPLWAGRYADPDRAPY